MRSVDIMMGLFESIKYIWTNDVIWLNQMINIGFSSSLGYVYLVID
ncbi:hypothetical protein [Candidatus Hodgkinia cicadicola]